jgi:N-acetylmuramoyl-L-alanine amidase
VYVGFEARTDARSLFSYYGVPMFESIGGRTLAMQIATTWRSPLPPAEVRGMRLPVLRETRMPAVLCSLGPVRTVVDATDIITESVVTALTSWTTRTASTDS